MAKYDDEKKMQLKEEELIAEKEKVQAGSAKIKKDVVTEPKTVEVGVKHEEATFERHPVEARPAESPIGEGEAEIPLEEERVQMSKQPYVREEATIKTRPVQETQRFTEEVSREEPRVEGVEEQ